MQPIAICLLAALAGAANAFFIDQKQSPQQHDWSYQEQSQWSRGFRQCNKNAQSPVDIQTKTVIANSQLRLQFFNYDQPIRFKLQNAHHTVKMNPLEQALDQFGLKLQPPGDSSTGDGIPDIITADEDTSAADSGVGTNVSSRLRASRPTARQPAPAPTGNSIEDSSSTPPGSQSAYNGAPTIKLDWLDDGNNEYKLRDIHFHWGERRDSGSEHAIDGSRSAMEMHLVHIRHGLDKSEIGFTSDSVAVIGILIESSRKSNTGFIPIVSALNLLNGTDQSQEVELRSISDLLPNKLHSFYTYSGSLTTPPCYQVVNWIVMAERLTMNAKQIEMFRNLFTPAAAGDDTSSENSQHLITPNVRHLQPLNNRTILASLSTSGKFDQMLASYSAATPGSGALGLHLVGHRLLGALLTLSLAIGMFTRR